MAEDIETHIAEVEALYEPLITSRDSRLDGGSKLWRQFTDAVSTYRKRGRAAFSGVIERVNELTVARILLADPTLADCRICYEPEIGDNHTKIDFVVPTPTSGTIYLEVKTVRPTAQDSEENWKKYQQRRKLHPSNVDYVVDKAWMGANIYGNSFSARSKFMDYTRAFEGRLSGALKAQSGRGVLVFCLSGLEWHVSELEDFADFYRNEKHRQDDPFSEMEAAALEAERVPLQRNISAFGFMNRPMGCATEEEWIADVRGPVRFS